MPRQFKRSYELTIDNPRGAKVITDLKLEFEITKSVLGAPNLAFFSLYNPSPDTLGLLQEKFTNVTLRVGYGGALEVLFTGQVRNVYQEKPREDSIVRIYSGDGERAWQTSVFNKTFSESISVKQIVQELLSTFKDIAIGTLEGLPEQADKLRGQTLSGNTKDLLNKYANEYNFQWSIQDGEVVVIPDDSALDQDDVILVNSSTGLIGSPTVTEIGADVTVLLNAELRPNRLFKVEAVSAQLALGNLYFRNLPRKTADGTYKVQEVRHIGDTRGPNWYSICRGMSYEL